jgi:hypothetical protein
VEAPSEQAVEFRFTQARSACHDDHWGRHYLFEDRARLAAGVRILSLTASVDSRDAVSKSQLQVVAAEKASTD